MLSLLFRISEMTHDRVCIYSSPTSHIWCSVMMTTARWKFSSNHGSESLITLGEVSTLQIGPFSRGSEQKSTNLLKFHPRYIGYKPSRTIELSRTRSLNNFIEDSFPTQKSLTPGVLGITTKPSRLIPTSHACFKTAA